MERSLKDHPINNLSNLSSIGKSSIDKISSVSSLLPKQREYNSSSIKNQSKVKLNKLLTNKMNSVVGISSDGNKKQYTLYIIIFIIIIILSFIGINIFIYLAYGTELIKNFSKPLISIISKILIKLGIITTDLALTGTKSIAKTGDGVVKTTSDNVTTGITGSIDQIKNTLNKNSDIDDNDSDTDSNDSELSDHKQSYCYIGKHKNKR